MAKPTPQQIGTAANELENRFSQLIALTTLIHGHGFESFSALHNQHQDHLLWLVHDMVSECRQLAGVVVWNEEPRRD